MFRIPATGVGVGRVDFCLKADSFPQVTMRGTSFLIGRGRGLCVETAQSALTVILKLVVDDLASVILIVLGTVNFQFQRWFVPISLKPVLGIVAAYVIATIWLSCS